MLDATDFLNSIKKAAKEAVDASQPSDFCYGKVIDDNPLKILVEQKMTLGKAQLVLTRNVTDFKTMVTVDWESEYSLGYHAHGVGATTSSDGKDPHTHTIDTTSGSINISHNHAIKGKKEITVHNALCIDDEVILLKQKGGQKYLVIDRVVNA